MHFVNPANLPLSRKTFSDFTAVKVESGIASQDEVNITLTDDGLSVSKAGIAQDQPYKFDPDRRPSKTFISDVKPGCSEGLFNRGEDFDKDPLIWIVTETLMIANNMDVELGVIHLDDALLICLQRGAIQVQIDDEGNTLELTRGIDGIPEDQKFMSATAENFAGMPAYASEAILNVTIRRGIKQIKKDSARSLETSVLVHKDTSALLDRGARFEREEAVRQAKEQEKAEAAARRAVEEAEAIARRDAEETEAAPNPTPRKRSSVSAKVKKDSSGRNTGAEAFFSASGLG